MSGSGESRSGDHWPSTCDGLNAADLCEAQGGLGALSHAMKPISPLMRMVGTAYTVLMPPADNLTLHYAMTRAGRGDVLVVDAAGYTESGVWGDILTAMAIHRGLAGLLIDGAVRDSAAIESMAFPVFSRAVSIKGSAKKSLGSVGIPICIDEVEIRTGDLVLGDRDGVVVVPAASVESTLAQARVRTQRETNYRRALAAGMTTVALLELGDVLRDAGVDPGPA